MLYFTKYLAECQTVHIWSDFPFDLCLHCLHDALPEKLVYKILRQVLYFDNKQVLIWVQLFKVSLAQQAL